MTSPRDRPRADIDRLVNVRTDESPERHRLSEFRDRQSYVLLGEPGSGKSTSFVREAEAAGSHVITAREFVGGIRPNGRVAFIDALEEYRIGEVGVDRLQSLIDAIASSGYDQWRLACRAISLPPSDALRIADRIGTFDTLQLEPLSSADQRMILQTIGESDPAAFQSKVEAMGAGALMGNPSTLLLLHDTLDRAETPIATRGELLAEATRQMAHELNPMMPERSDRPPAVHIVAAAESACLVLLLSTRTDIWMHSALPPDRSFVTRDDLLPARVDTQALRAALDTPMFSGDGDTFIPAHRFVAEYLGGQALARATAPSDPSIPALSLNRAVAFLHGDNDRPAPALTGIYAWFVTALAQTVHADRALALVRRDPEAVLFHGDAAMLPPQHRRALLDSIGRDDPWFLAGNRGSTALAGLAGSDLAEAMEAILLDPAETDNRKALVLMALSSGRPVPELAGTIFTIFATEGASDHFDRRFSLAAYANIVGATPETYRIMLDAIASQTSAASIQLRLELLAALVPGADLEEIRDTLLAYAQTGDGVMGYARPLGAKLEKHPMPALFDAPLEVKRHTGQSRYHEVTSLLERLLAATIRSAGDLSAARLLSWLSHIGIDDLCTPEDEIRLGISVWLDAVPRREQELFDAIIVNIGGPGCWGAPYDFHRLTGRELSLEMRTLAVERAESATDAEIPNAAQIAHAVIRPFERHAELYWRLWRTLDGRSGCEALFVDLTVGSVDHWRVRDAARNQQRSAERAKVMEEDRMWYRTHLEEVRSGESKQGLFYAADVYLGYLDGGGDGPDQLAAHMNDADTVAAVRSGWHRFASAEAGSVVEVGRRSAGSTIFRADQVRVAWADDCLRAGIEIAAPLSTLFSVANYAYMLANQREGVVREFALGRIYAAPEAARSLGDFWCGAVAARSRGLPFYHQLDTSQPSVHRAILCLLERRPAIREGVLDEALQLAARSLGPAALLDLAKRALARALPIHARRLWAFTAFILDPENHTGILGSEFPSPDGHRKFANLLGGELGKLAKMEGEEALVRLGVIISGLGPTWAPPDSSDRHSGSPANSVGSSIDWLTRIPTATATEMIKKFINTGELSEWHTTLQHALAQQTVTRREAEFRPPAPAAIAAALAAGPPATAGDLRAIIKETLDELAEDIRHGDTSPWKGFWNRPSRTNATPDPVNTPKIENDCRDLLTDRLGDRLRRYGIPVKQVQTEGRSGNDRRADIMIVLGDGAGSVPVEAKRHWNDELWTAVRDQLVPYCRTAGSNGHGIYLIFWFGSAWQVPALPDGSPRPTTPAELRQALVDRLPTEVANSIGIVVIDASEPTR
jgi:hypothetical protein